MNIIAFDDKLHALLVGLFDRAEEKLVATGICQADRADEWLTIQYIKETGTVVWGGQTYLPNDEYIGADIFLSYIADAQFKRLSIRRRQNCALQLSTHTQVYFPQYNTILRLSYLHFLHSNKGNGFEVTHNGIVLLAAAKLPGVINDIRRELRRRGSKYDHLLVQNDILNVIRKYYDLIKCNTSYLNIYKNKN